MTDFPIRGAQLNPWRTQRELHEEMLFFDLVPEPHVPRDASFQVRWALSLRLELFFRGEISLRQ